VIYGAKGAGKSMMVENMFSNQRGIVKHTVTSNKKDEIVTMLFSKVLRIQVNEVLLDLDKMVESLRKCKVVPTFIFDVELGGSPDQAQGIQAVRSLCKALAPVSRCIVILSEADMVLEFGRDLTRAEFAFVDEFTPEEAKELMKKKNISLSASQQQYLFESIGANPSLLVMLHRNLKKGMSLEDFVEMYLQYATQDLVAFPHKPILAALKKFPDGVKPAYFNNQRSKGVDLSSPTAVASSIEYSNAIIYRVEQTKYQLMSTAHRTALWLNFPHLDG
jgi:hypothetical protein